MPPEKANFPVWNTTYGKVCELTENDEGYDFKCLTSQIVWIKP